ncbi:hypothetical protein JCM11491_003603 [Sporobolomyces phaffii]
MKSLVLRIDPSNSDFDPLAVSTSPPADSHIRQTELGRLWNAWNAKARKLLDQDSRIENLFWRRWHLERKRDMYSHQQPLHPSSQYPAPPYHAAPPPLAAPSNSHFDRINEAGRQASRDLEAFLSNTLHNTQPAIVPCPPTFPPSIPPSPYSQLRQNLTNATPSPSVPHSHVVAPQPYRPAPFAQLPHQYQPSPEWAYTALPPVSMPPSLPQSSQGGQNRIIATPSWTALIQDSSPQLQQNHAPPQPAAANYYPPAAPPLHPNHHPPQPPTVPSHYPSSLNPALHPHPQPQTQPHPPPPPNPYSFFAHPHSSAPPTLHTPSFTLPPSATVFTDLPSALSSAPGLDSAPLSFYSSYGSYQPIITPYPRFLTPSPEPSILGELELELSELDHLATTHTHGASSGGANGTTGTARAGAGAGATLDYESVIGANGGADDLHGGPSGVNGGGGDDEDGVTSDEDGVDAVGGGGDQDMKAVWNEFRPPPVPSTSAASRRDANGAGVASFSTSAPTYGAAGSASVAGSSSSKRDPFEGMSLAQIRSRANSLEAVDRDAARYEAFGVGSGLEPSDRAAFEVRDEVKKGKGKAKEKPKGGKRKNARGDGGTVGKKNRNAAAASTASSPSTVESTSPNLAGSDDASPTFDHTGAKVLSAAAVSKKNRNPHATQLPGSNQHAVGKDEAGDGHSGPICSHCGSITTPLWRRGPDDELLCNACGLYLKLHSKPRPKTFGKGAGGSKRALNGAAAKAAASGEPPVCSNCACTSTPMWRVLEGKLSCNACSLYFKLHKVPRPASLAQKRAAAAAAKLDLAADPNPPSAATSPADRPSILTPSDTSSAPTPASTVPTAAPTPAHASGADPSDMITSPATVVAPLQPAVMPPPHDLGSMRPPPVPATWAAPIPMSTSPFQPPVSLPGSDPNPFAQTSWGALAYQLVSAAAEEEAGQVGPGGPST